MRCTVMIRVLEWWFGKNIYATPQQTYQTDHLRFRQIQGRNIFNFILLVPTYSTFANSSPVHTETLICFNYSWPPYTTLFKQDLWRIGPVNTTYWVPPQVHLKGQTCDNKSTCFLFHYSKKHIYICYWRIFVVCTVRLLTHVLCKPTHFLFHSFIAVMSYSLQTRFGIVTTDWADKYHVWGTPTRSPPRSNSR